MKLDRLDEIIAYVLPLRFTMRQLYEALGGEGEPSLNVQKQLGHALRARGGQSYRTSHRQGRHRVWVMDPDATERALAKLDQLIHQKQDEMEALRRQRRAISDTIRQQPARQ